MTNSDWQERAAVLDAEDSLQAFRAQFLLPTHEEREDVYFVGNSLGLQPVRTRSIVEEELDRWSRLGVRGHFEGEPSWIDYQDCVAPTMAELVGAKPSEVVVMNTLTVNLHLMLATFYQPSGNRRKILIEDHAFPSDHQAVASHLEMRGQSPDEDLIVHAPRRDSWLFDTNEICERMRRERDALALVLLPGVQYYSGQVFDMETLARTANELQIPIGFDLAHAAGNIPLALHDWNADFACWCTYKYLNSGPGALGGCFVHERHAVNPQLPRLAGWWGHERSSRFEMKPDFRAAESAQGWQLSNPPILSLAGVRASMLQFAEAGRMEPLREKSLKLSRFFRTLLNERLEDRVTIVTPTEPRWAGCQLSLEIHNDSRSGKEIYQRLCDARVWTDWREPNVIRAAPAPLYNSFHDVGRFVETLENALA